MQLIKVKFLKGDVPSGRAYTYSSEVVVKPGDEVILPAGGHGVVTEIDVPESEGAAFRDKLKAIEGKAPAEQE